MHFSNRRHFVLKDVTFFLLFFLRIAIRIFAMYRLWSYIIRYLKWIQCEVFSSRCRYRLISPFNLITVHVGDHDDDRNVEIADCFFCRSEMFDRQSINRRETDQETEVPMHTHRNNRATALRQREDIPSRVIFRYVLAFSSRTQLWCISRRANKALITNYKVKPLKLHCGGN